MSATAPLARASDDPALAKLFKHDRALVKIGRKIKVLKAIDWPLEHGGALPFLVAARKARTALAGHPSHRC